MVPENRQPFATFSSCTAGAGFGSTDTTAGVAGVVADPWAGVAVLVAEAWAEADAGTIEEVVVTEMVGAAAGTGEAVEATGAEA